jgi:hypothetical protein
VAGYLSAELLDVLVVSNVRAPRRAIVLFVNLKHSAAHFNREYKSLFGVPPMRDVQRLRIQDQRADSALVAM